MSDSYDFVGGPLNGERRPLGPSDFPLRVEGGTYRLTGGGHALGGQKTAYTALFWPDRGDGPGVPVKVGDPFPLGADDVGDCSATKHDPSGMVSAFCVLDDGHSPAPHVASNVQVIVEIWT